MHSDPATAVLPPSGDGAAEWLSAARPAGLTRREHDMLTFERQWWRRPGAKETAIRNQFGMTPTRYYQVLNTLVDRADALATDPLLVRRLRRVRAARRHGRSAQMLGNGALGV
jgi:hypothetical protein